MKKLIYTKSVLNLKDEFDIQYLNNFKSSYLLEIHIEDSGDVIEYLYDDSGYFTIDYVKSLNRIKQLEFLLNIRNIFSIDNNIDFNIFPNNLLVDEFLNPKIIFRDIRSEIKKSYIEEYKTLIGYILSDKVDINDALNCGSGILDTDDKLYKYRECSTISDIVDLLAQDLDDLRKYNENNNVICNKKKYKLNKNLTKIFSVLSIFLLVVTGLLYYNNNIKNNRLQLYTNYVENDYQEVINELDDIKYKHLTKEDKYIISNAIIKLSNFSTEQQNNINKSISINGDDNILNYWTYIAYKNYDKAYDIGLAINEDSYIAYALNCKYKQIEADTNMDAETKKEELSKIKDQLKEYGYEE